MLLFIYTTCRTGVHNKHEFHTFEGFSLLNLIIPAHHTQVLWQVYKTSQKDCSWKSKFYLWLNNEWLFFFITEESKVKKICICILFVVINAGRTALLSLKHAFVIIVNNVRFSATNQNIVITPLKLLRLLKLPLTASLRLISYFSVSWMGCRHFICINSLE